VLPTVPALIARRHVKPLIDAAEEREPRHAPSGPPHRRAGFARASERSSA
jgi:hypothetical protein